MIPADMTPDRLREDALILATLDYHRTAKRYVRWADELEAQPTPDPDVLFPVGARVMDLDGDIATVIGVHGDWRWLFGNPTEPWSRVVQYLSPAPPPTVAVPADVVARILANDYMSLTRDDRAVLARAAEAAS